MLLIKDLIEPLKCSVLSCHELADSREVTGGYACDLLSWVISKVQSGEVWMTILNSVNVIAVAVLAECSCVLLTEGVLMEDQVLSRAEEKGIIVMSTPLSTYAACALLHRLVEQAND